MSNVFAKLRDFVGLNDPADYEYEYEEMDGEEYQNLYQEENPQPPVQPMPAEEPRSRRRLRERTMTSDTGMNPMASNVIGMPGAMNRASEVVVMEPAPLKKCPRPFRRYASASLWCLT